MAPKLEELAALVQLRAGAAMGTTLTATDASILATDLKDARLESAREGLLILAIEVLDTTTGDETYQLDLIGRDNNSDTYDVLASITPTAAGLYVVGVSNWRKQLNYALTVAGTTPILGFAALVVINEATYQPLKGAVITA